MSEYTVGRIELGPLQCSQGGKPYNNSHINYWKAEAERLKVELERACTEHATMREALEEIEKMEPGLIDGDSSADASAVVAGMALAAVSGKQS